MLFTKSQKCNLRVSNTPNSSATNLQPPIISTSDTYTNPTYYHQHQHTHTHTHFLHTPNTPKLHPTPSSTTSSCIQKLLIYTLLFIVAYYLLFLALSTTYKHQKHKSSLEINTILIENPIDTPQVPINTNPLPNPSDIDTNTDNIIENNIPKTDSITNKLQRNKSQREKFLERKRKRREQRKTRLARLRGENIDIDIPVGKKRKHMHEDKYESLPRFAELYISDNPYFLDNNIVIIGQLSNAELHLKSILAQLLEVSCLYNSTTFILFESNSIDNTSLYLDEFVKNGQVDCSGKMFNPEHVNKYGNMRTLDELMNVFDTSLAEYNNSEYSDYDDIVYGILSNYTKLTDIDMKEIEWLLNEQITTNNIKLNEIEIEEIIYNKLSVIKYVKYYTKIFGSLHYLNKYIISGDNYIEKELETELKILKLLNLYDGVNEFHMDKNGNIFDKRYNALEKIRFKHLNIHTLNDFENEFNDIHNEIEGLIENDEDIIYQRLKDKQAAFAKKRKELRKQRQMKMNENNNNKMEMEMEMKNKEFEEQKWNEYYNRFRDKLYRIERFVVYRNMLLKETMKKSIELGINFDYIMNVDMDIYNMDVRTFMNELYYSPDEIHGMCIDGIDWMGFTRDTFATVKTNGGWLHYGHDMLVNDTYYIYNNEHALFQRTLIPNSINDRFYEVKSCFGGVIIYKNYMNDLFNSECKYTLTRDIFYKTYNDTNINKYTYNWWLYNRYHNKYSEESKLELQLFREQYIELLQMEDKRIKNRQHFPRDGDICEHIPFHYCLYDYGWKFAISSRAKLYYDQMYPVNRLQNDTNWKKYFNNRPIYTKS